MMSGTIRFVITIRITTHYAMSIQILIDLPFISESRRFASGGGNAPYGQESKES